MTFIACKVSMTNQVTEKHYWAKYAFELSQIESFRPNTNDDMSEMEKETILYFKSGESAIVNIGYFEILNRVSKMRFSYN